MTTPAPPEDKISNKEGIVSPAWVLWFLQVRRKIDEVIQEESTHTTSDGTSHSHVVLNDAHRISDGSDHSLVTDNQTDIAALQASEGANTNAITLNTNHRLGGGADHAGVSQNTANIEALMANTQVVDVLLGENMSKGELFYFDMPVATVKGYQFDISAMDYKYCCGILTDDGVTDDYVTGILFGGCFYWEEEIGDLTPQDVLYLQADNTISTVETDYFVGIIIEEGLIHLSKNRGDELELINVNIDDIADNVDDINTLGGFVNTNTTDIATNADDIDDLEADVAVINDVIPYREFTLGENISAGKLVYTYDDSGTPKIKECIDQGDLKSHYGDAGDHDICVINESLICTVFADEDNGYRGTVILSTIAEGNLIENGTAYQFTTNVPTDMAIERVSEDTIFIKYKNNQNILGVAATISGDTFTFGNTVTFNAAPCLYSDLVKINEDVCVAGFVEGTSLKVRPVTISGSTSTLGYVNNFQSFSAWTMKLAETGFNDEFVFFYGHSAECYARVGTVTSTGATAQISMGAGAAIITARIAIYDAVNIARKRIVLIVQNVTASNYGQTIVCDVGTTVTSGSPNFFYYGGFTGASGCKSALDGNFFVNYSYSGGSAIVEAIAIGDFTEIRAPLEYEAQAYLSLKSVRLCGYKYVVGFITTPTAYLFVYDDGNTTNGNMAIGILNETGTTGQSKPVAMDGSVTDSLSSLEIGKKYYYDEDLSIALTKTNLMVGIAISTTELLLIRK